jgi:hypothetical protein
MSIASKHVRLWLLFALWLPLCSQQALAAGGTLANGANVTGTLNPGQQDTWTFHANQGDFFWVRVSENGPNSAFVPQVQVLGPDGTNYGVDWGDLRAGVQGSANTAGTFTVLLKHNDGAAVVGKYILTFVQSPESFVVPGGDQGGPMTNGQNYTGSLLRGDLDPYSVSANQGDDIWVRVSEAGPNTAFVPQITLIGPDGKNYGVDWGDLFAGVHTRATVSGTYTVVISRNDGADGVGQYLLTLAHSPGTFIVAPGDEGGPISDGQIKLGAVLRGDLDQWAFTATQGDDIWVRVSETGTNSAFVPQITLIRPDGVIENVDWGDLRAGVHATAALTGKYTAIVSRNDGADGVGTYSLTLEKSPSSPVVPDGETGGPMTNGQNYNGTLSRGDLDLWTFEANQGDTFWVRISEVGTNTAFVPQINVIGPTGTSYGVDWGDLRAGIFSTANETGTFTVIVSRNDGSDGVGSYQVTSARTPGAFVIPAGDDGGPMASGQSYSGTLLRGDLDQWTFYANAGANISVSVGVTGAGSSFVPQINLFGPDGSQYGSNWGNPSASIQVTAGQSGAYKVVVSRNDGADGVGTYSLSEVTIPTASPAHFYLNLGATPDAGGTIKATPASPSGYYQSGTKVCLAASPAAGYIFTKWTGASLDSSGCLVVTSNLSVTANFAALKSLRFVPITPCRLADTRYTAGPYGGPALAAGTSRDFVVPDASSCSIPYTAEAYSLNVTAVPSGKLNYMTVWPTGQPQPTVSTLNSPDGRVKANAAIIPAGTDGGVSVYATDTTNVILDVNGYFVPSSSAGSLGFYPVKPCRIADTRSGSGSLGGPSLDAGQARTFPVLSSSCGLPSSAKAYSLNFTAVPKKKLGYLSVWPTGQQQPTVSTLNAPTGAVTANAAIVPAGSNGGVDVYASDDTDLIVDVNGYFAPPASGALSLYNVTPCRVLDTRANGGKPFTGTKTVNASTSACSVPTGSQALVLNATVVPPGPFSYLTLWAAGQPQPTVSTLNAPDGAVTSNLAIVPDAKGAVNAFASNPTQLILDISGYFAP